MKWWVTGVKIFQKNNHFIIIEWEKNHQIRMHQCILCVNQFKASTFRSTTLPDLSQVSLQVGRELASCCTNKEEACLQTSTYFIFPWGKMTDEQIVHFSKTGLRLTSNSWHCLAEASLKIIHTDKNDYSNATSLAGIYTSRLSRRTSSLNET